MSGHHRTRIDRSAGKGRIYVAAWAVAATLVGLECLLLSYFY